MNTNRLERLERLLLLEAAKPQAESAVFNMEHWIAPMKDDGEPGMAWYGDIEEPLGAKMDCGTSACAFGLAALSGEFADDGLTCEKLAMLQGRYIISPVYNNLSGMTAAARFFDITLNEAEYLFDPSAYPDERLEGKEAEAYVAKRIHDFMDGKIDNRWYPGSREDEDCADGY